MRNLSPREDRTSEPGLEHSWWVVLGRSKETVRQLVDLQQKGMPGFYQPDKEVDVKVSPVSTVFLRTVVAGAIGGLAVLIGLAKVL
jgi:hypothetical protein